MPTNRWTEKIQLKETPQNVAGHAEKDKDYDLVYAIQQFVAENYANPNICLDMVASHVYVHSSYVSHIFSEKFNIGFRDYVNWLRIKKAKELLGGPWPEERFVHVAPNEVVPAKPFMFLP